MSNFVVDGTKLQCTMGTESAELKTSAPRSLSIGGKEKVENLEKVKTKVHIELITQMMGRIE